MYNGILGFVSFNWNSELFWPTSPQSLHPMTSGMTILFASASSIFLTLQMSYFHLQAQGSQSVTDSEAYPAPQHMCTLTHSPPPPTLNQPRYFKPCFDLLCISVTLFLSVFIFIFFSGGEHIALSPRVARFHFLSLSCMPLWPPGMWLRAGWMVYTGLGALL